VKRDMFYESRDRIDKLLRLGDVVKGYISNTTRIKQPFLTFESSVFHNYTVNFEVPLFSVVLTPCCSIGEQNMICLSPLIQLKSDFFKNPYLVEDFTRINREIEPNKAIAPDDWDKMSYEEKQEKLAQKKGYIEYYLFIYEPSNLFPPYKKKLQVTQYYMVDFRNIQTIRCELIQSREKTKEENTEILASKCLQLSKSTREELRQKLAHYFGRRPLEDELE
jgi:hypothetical protein